MDSVLGQSQPQQQQQQQQQEHLPSPAAAVKELLVSMGAEEHEPRCAAPSFLVGGACSFSVDVKISNGSLMERQEGNFASRSLKFALFYP